MLADKPTELSRIKIKNLNIHTYIHTYLLLLIQMLWHRQAIFESKGDNLSSSAESRIRTQGVYETQSSADWMPADKPTELSRIKLKNLNSTARPYDQQAFSPPDPTAIWHSHLALAILRHRDHRVTQVQYIPCHMLAVSLFSFVLVRSSGLVDSYNSTAFAHII